MTSSDPSAFGKYRLIAELGHGGMADVFLAVNQGPAGFSKLVVLKRLRAQLADDPEFIAMLVDEARLAARLNHPNVVQTNEVGNVGESYYIAMEYLDGQPLHRILHRARAPEAMPLRVRVAILSDVLSGLQHAHELADFDGTPLNVVHRDVTPHNIFVTYDGQVKVVDFGIAKAAGRGAAETRQGVIKGKVAYMSPEQAMCATLDARADVFAVGIMLWEAATGRRLWKNVEDMQILHCLIAGNVPISPRAENPDVPEELDRICQCAMAIRSDLRYASAAAMQLDLEQFLTTIGGRPATREVGRIVAELFSDRRDELKTIVEAKLSELKTVPVSQFMPATIDSIASLHNSASGSGPNSSTASMRLARDMPGEEGTKLTGVTGETRLSEGRHTGARIIGAGIIAVGVLASAAIFIRHRTPDPGPVDTAQSVVHATAAIPSSAPPPVVDASVAHPLTTPDPDPSASAAHDPDLGKHVRPPPVHTVFVPQPIPKPTAVTATASAATPTPPPTDDGLTTRH